MQSSEKLYLGLRRQASIDPGEALTRVFLAGEDMLLVNEQRRHIRIRAAWVNRGAVSNLNVT